MRLLPFFALLVLSTPALAAYDKPYIGDMKEYRADYEDTFVHLARDYGLGYVEMRAANPDVDPWLPGDGTKLILPMRHILPDAPRSGVVINLPEMRLYAYVNGDDAPTTYPIGIGREGLDTPLGKTSVVRKAEGPIWRPTPRMRKEKPELPEEVGPGPENPMGTHALYLGFHQIAIHGTDRPFGIGRRISSGCIRLYPEDIIALYKIIPVGTEVTVVNQPIKLAWIDDQLFMEAHPTVEQAIQMEEAGEVKSSPKLSDSDMERIMKAAGQYKDHLRWPAIRTAVRERRGYPIAIARRPAGGEEPVALDDKAAKEAVEATKEEKKAEKTDKDSAEKPEVKAEKKSDADAGKKEEKLADNSDKDAKAYDGAPPKSTLNP